MIQFLLTFTNVRNYIFVYSLVLCLHKETVSKLYIEIKNPEKFLTKLKDMYAIMEKGCSFTIKATKEVQAKLNLQLILNGLVHRENKEGFALYEKPGYAPKAKKLVKKDKKSVWKLMTEQEEDFDIEDEEALLDDEEDIVVKPKEDCSTETTKKRACKNCSCGLKEMLDSEEKTSVQPNASSCGNCSKGDAFRCGGCPYRGLPKFTPGAKPEIEVLNDGSKVLLDISSSDFN